MPTDLKPSTPGIEAAALGGTELIPCAQGGTSKALTPAQVSAYTGTDFGLSKKAAGQLRVLTQVWAERFYSEDGGGAVGAFESGNISLAAGKILSWTNGGGAGGTGDTGIRRAAAGVVLATDGGSGLGAQLAGRVVEASTAGVGAPNILAATESRKLLTNDGATAEAYNSLPVGAPAGCEFQAYCGDTDGIRLTAPTGETIRTGPGAITAAAGFIKSVVVGSGITLTKKSSTEWVAVNAPNGTWTIDS